MVARHGIPLLLFSLLPLGAADDWPQFRGPNSSGVSANQGLPVEMGPNRNLVWKTELPAGHSSPILVGDSIFLTGYDAGKLFVFSLDRSSGRIKWRREVPRPRKEDLHVSNSPASPSAVSDGKNVYAFFTDFGLISFGPDGNERWRLPLGPFNNPMGMGASPVLTGKRLLLNCDQESGSYFLSVDKDTGKVLWRAERPDFTRGFSTPVLYRPPDGALQAVIAGSRQLTAYDVETGKPVWWVDGLTWQLKPTPVMSKDVIYVQGWAGGADNGEQESVIEFGEALKIMDADHDGRISKDEFNDPKLKADWRSMDLDDDGYLNERDWKQYRNRRSAVNALMAIRLGGHGDMTQKSLLWRYYKSLPNVPSPLLYQDVLYMMKEGGILTALDPATGEVTRQGRLTGALGPYFASPVAADNKIYALSHEGKLTVIKPGRQWEILAVNDLADEANGTPAIADNRLYVRTRGALWCFAQKR
jgi:outer membrane protein assembly factor BamB